MLLFEIIVALLCGAVILAAIARRVGAPYPAFLAVGGALLALVPGGPHLTLDPQLALALFVAPVLLDAAYDASLRDLRDNWAPLTALILVAVTLTATGVAGVARALRPELSWAVALVIGAVVAPPDAAAATAVLSQVRPPHRIMVVLEGESLFNDAVALLLYRLGVSAVTEAGFSLGRVVPTSVVAVIGSVVAGLVLARVWQRLTAKVSDVRSSIVLQFVSTFGVWLFAERIGLSGVLTIVVYAIALARNASSFPARLRVPSFAVWDTVVFVANVLAFMLIGLQLRPILDRLSPAQRLADLGFAAAVLATVIGIRIAWVMAYNTATRWRIHRRGVHARRSMAPPTVQSGLLVSWCGMRGIVTLAAALALPARFPARDLVVLTAFVVVLGTLLIQGLSLKPLVRALDIRDDNPVEREIRLAWNRSLEAALQSLGDERSREATALRQEYAQALESLSRSPEDQPAAPSLPTDELRRRAVAAARDALTELRDRDEIGDAAFQAVQDELDRLELSTF